jgi:hypothetical protein
MEGPIEPKGKLTIECYGMSFSKELPAKVAYAILMDQLPKQREQH